MSDSIRIIPAETRHAKMISILNNEVQGIHARAFPHIFKPPTKNSFSTSEVVELMHKPRTVIYVAESNGSIVGYAYAEIRQYPEDSIQYSQNVIYLHHISVRQSSRRKGVGQALIQALMRLARERKISIVMLDVWSFNTDAREFFKKQGFSVFTHRMWLNL